MTSEPSSSVLERLVATISERRQAGAEKSYTKSLLEAGPEKCAKKFGEEAVEAALAGVGEDPDHLHSEAADVIYHLLVLLEARGVKFADVLTELDSRTRQSGHEEKAARGR